MQATEKECLPAPGEATDTLPTAQAVEILACEARSRNSRYRKGLKASSRPPQWPLPRHRCPWNAFCLSRSLTGITLTDFRYLLLWGLPSKGGSGGFSASVNHFWGLLSKFPVRDIRYMKCVSLKKNAHGRRYLRPKTGLCGTIEAWGNKGRECDTIA
jgi:hypothetical protein